MHGEFAIGDGDDAQPVFIQLARQIDGALGGIGRERRDHVLVAHVRADGENFFDGAFANEHVRRLLLLEDDGHALAREVPRDLVDFAEIPLDAQLFPQILVLEHRAIEQAAEPRLVRAVQVGEREHRLIVFAHHVEVALEDDAVLRQRARLVGAEHVHRAEILNGIEAFDDRLVARHDHRALGQVRGDDHRQHLGR